MLTLNVSGERVSYDTLDEAREAAAASGRGVEFWRETLEACVHDEGAWNDLLNDLWQSGGERETERLNVLFGEPARRHWLLMALELGTEEAWSQFLDVWKVKGDGIVEDVVRCAGFMPWLKQVRPKKYDVLPRVFGVDSSKWSVDLLLRALRSEGADADVVEWQNELEKRNEPKPGEEMTITLPGGVPMTFCWCPATISEDWKRISGGKGYFLMGSPESEEGRNYDEQQHRVTLTNGFWMGKYEVTQRQWKCAMDGNPSCFNGEDRPVEMVSWDSCQAFIRKVNADGRMRVALPTEAQWEYACRAGTSTPFSFGLTLNGDKANCDGNYPYGTETRGCHREETFSVGSYESNAWGLYDMHGNVWEWCADWYDDYAGDETDPTGPASGFRRVIRGGGWNSIAYYCRSACRDSFEPRWRAGSFGFRLVCTMGPHR